MDARGVEQKSGARRARELSDLGSRHGWEVRGADPAWRVLAVRPLDIVEGTTSHIGQVETELYFLRNLLGDLLVVPFIAVPSVKVPPGGQGSPAPCLDQRECS